MPRKGCTNRRAAGALEYVLLLALVALLSVGVISAIGDTTRTVFDTVASSIGTPPPPTDPGTEPPVAPEEPDPAFLVLDASPAPIGFSFDVESSQRFTVTVRNTGEAVSDTLVGAFSFSGQNANAMTIDTLANSCVGALAGAQTCAFDVVVSAAAPGTLNAALSVSANNGPGLTFSGEATGGCTNGGPFQTVDFSSFATGFGESCDETLPRVGNNAPSFTDTPGAPVSPRFGSHVLDFTRSGASSDFIRYPAGTQFDFQTEDFTIEMWVNFKRAGSERQDLFAKQADPGGSVNLSYAVVKANGQQFCTAANQIRFQARHRAGEQPPSVVVCSATRVQPGTWYHLAAVREGNHFRLYINGVREASQTMTDTGQFDGDGRFIIAASDGEATIGKHPAINDRGADIYLDGLKATTGIARYGPDFTPGAIQ